MKILGIFSLALLFATGFCLNFFACVVYEMWLPFIILLLWFMMPFPAFLWIPPKDRWGLDPTTDDCTDFAFFVTGVLLMAGLVTPIMMAKYGFIPIGAAYMSFAGCITFCAAAIIFAKGSLGAWTSDGPF